MPTVKVRNKPYDFKAVKVDGADNSPLPGVHFSLHRQAVRINGELGKFYLPVEGYEDLVTGSDGVIPGINRDLPAGTYYLCEIDPPAGYDRISEDVCFTVSAGGIVTIAEGTDRNLAVASDPDTGEVSYTLSIVNAGTIRTIRFKKVDVANTDRALEGAVFDL